MIAILGGGLSGLQLGRRLLERGEDVLVLEKRDEVGGLCRTIVDGDYSWDLGPHGFYSKKPEAMEYYRSLPLEYRSLERDVRVCHRDGPRVHEVGYPFENGLADLPLAHRLECVAGYCWASWRGGGGPFRHLRHWIEDGLGGGIARHFMRPYNEKIWSCPLDRISMDLVKQKIEPEKPWNIIRHGLRSGSVGRAYQARFLYPRGGGAGAVPRAVAAALGERVKTGVAAARLSRGAAGWTVHAADGRTFEAERVVSTMPIPELLDAVGDPELSALRSEFRFNDTLFVVVGLRRGRRFSRFDRCQWVFFAGPETFYRVSLMHAFDEDRPATLVAEITANGRGDGLAGDAAVSLVLRDLREAGLLADESDVALARAHREPYTYPIPTIGLPRALETVERSLGERGLYLLGRMGRWQYVNTDGVFLGVDEFLARHQTFARR